MSPTEKQWGAGFGGNYICIQTTAGFVWTRPCDGKRGKRREERRGEERRGERRERETMEVEERSKANRRQRWEVKSAGKRKRGKRGGMRREGGARGDEGRWEGRRWRREVEMRAEEMKKRRGDEGKARLALATPNLRCELGASVTCVLNVSFIHQLVQPINHMLPLSHHRLATARFPLIPFLSSLTFCWDKINLKHQSQSTRKDRCCTR